MADLKFTLADRVRSAQPATHPYDLPQLEQVESMIAAVNSHAAVTTADSTSIAFSLGGGGGQQLSGAVRLKTGGGIQADADGLFLNCGSAYDQPAAGNHTHPLATAGNSGFMAAAHVVKLDGIQDGAQANAGIATPAEMTAGNVTDVRSVSPALVAIAINDRLPTVPPATDEAEVDEGLEVGMRLFSPALVKRAVDQHGVTLPQNSSLQSVKVAEPISDPRTFSPNVVRVAALYAEREGTVFMPPGVTAYDVPFDRPFPANEGPDAVQLSVQNPGRDQVSAFVEEGSIDESGFRLQVAGHPYEQIHAGAEVAWRTLSEVEGKIGVSELPLAFDYFINAAAHPGTGAARVIGSGGTNGLFDAGAWMTAENRRKFQHGKSMVQFTSAGLNNVYVGISSMVIVDALQGGATLGEGADNGAPEVMIRLTDGHLWINDGTTRSSYPGQGQLASYNLFFDFEANVMQVRNGDTSLVSWTGIGTDIPLPPDVLWSLGMIFSFDSVDVLAAKLSGSWLDFGHLNW